jgi:hypothetical protein
MSHRPANKRLDNLALESAEQLWTSRVHGCLQAGAWTQRAFMQHSRHAHMASAVAATGRFPGGQSVGFPVRIGVQGDVIVGDGGEKLRKAKRDGGRPRNSAA